MILLAASLSIFLPLLLAHWSIYSILLGLFQVGLMTFATCLFLNDLKIVLHEKYQLKIQQCSGALRNIVNDLDSLVLDDVLQSMFDPQGWIATGIATWFASAVVYGMPTWFSKEQRVLLAQSAFDVDKEEAEKIMISPGGFARVFPQKVQGWLELQQRQQDKDAMADGSSDSRFHFGQVPSLDDDSTSESLEVDSSEHRHSGTRIQQSSPLSCTANATRLPNLPDYPPHRVPKRRMPGANAATRPPASTVSVPVRDAAPQRQPTPTLPSPSQLLGSMLLNMIQTGVYERFQSVSSGRVLQLSISAGVLLLAQCTTSQRARKMLLWALEGSALAGAVGLLSGSAAFIAAKLSLSDHVRSNAVPASDRLTNLQSLWRACTTSLSKGKKWQGLVAVLIMIYYSRRRLQLTRGSRPRAVP
jgi:hypothetical protein